jgi:hypothetical protein
MNFLTLAVWWVAAAVIFGVALVANRRKGRRQQPASSLTINLGNSPDELRVNRKRYQIRLKELRIQMTELAGAEQMVRTTHRARRTRGSHRGFVGSILRYQNVQAGYAADKGFVTISHQRQWVRTEMVNVERIINQIDSFLLADGGGRGGRQRRRKQ